MGHYAGYTEEDFVALLNVLSKVKGKFMLSSYPSQILREFADAHGWDVFEYVLPRSAGGGVKTEVLTLNYTVAQEQQVVEWKHKEHGQMPSENEYEYALAA
jgi:DNA adenine methylase